MRMLGYTTFSAETTPFLFVFAYVKQTIPTVRRRLCLRKNTQKCFDELRHMETSPPATKEGGRG